MELESNHHNLKGNFAFDRDLLFYELKQTNATWKMHRTTRKKRSKCITLLNC